MLLTGATGFFGKHVVAMLLGQGHKIIIGKRRSSDLTQIRSLFGTLEAWNIDEAGFSGVFTKHPDICGIVHAATNYGRDITPTATFWANVAMPIKLLELGMSHSVSMFVNMDTFFNSASSNYSHLSAYTLSKRHLQEWGQQLGRDRRINFVNLRLHHLYGAGDGQDKFVPTIVRRCLAGDEIDLTDGSQERDFIHVEDAASAVATVLQAKVTGSGGYHHYDVGTGNPVSIRSFVETVNRLCSAGAKLNFGTLPMREGEFRRACADTSALRALGWAPHVSLETGIQSVIDDMSQRNYKTASIC